MSENGWTREPFVAAIGIGAPDAIDIFQKLGGSNIQERLETCVRWAAKQHPTAVSAKTDYKHT